METAFRLNGAEVTAEADDDTPLLYILRNDMGLNSPKYGCGLAQCGSCRVIVDGDVAPSCSITLASVAGKTIETLEGIGTPGRLHPLQEAFLAEQAAQCGYCTAGMIMAAKALLDRNRDPSDNEIREALERNLCRCGTYHRIIRAVRRAAREMAR
ncbi:(2Fe-2S)-binding protein [Rhizobium sp. LCM 4573]|uniref:(2Fe-2S)-binding protein n=1 Tax=Rhizobium sp. LCM 4573 TaxID=1848291 RepID=UPI0008D9ECC2|nr:(2Fe-2S)-binding protein [Rhizobium sp. LCM 4573]OHV77257.1 (2Fe-2S)-binding protein [Rhizobium sp. LCM 4573]